MTSARRFAWAGAAASKAAASQARAPVESRKRSHEPGHSRAPGERLYSRIRMSGSSIVLNPVCIIAAGPPALNHRPGTGHDLEGLACAAGIAVALRPI